ncbi:GlsB/YeaQ/YmgE family stress response membrane protein [Labrys sp. KNU-23]|uniref:GlsB/YeaQ/YmgE family stress response membrane protein n=1 Tax=Labrys sp. KNU-23 TaxID=2789216 RepID=UPI0011EFF3A2|nr:GlsB/YeaQ/YmgE family stress response membrane protein [Labrys sp. KNU-23]QEN88933.1 GlsB/YeaQ/YmgE family stress response membrane protein [Labrys sp. KNU-23]
MENPQVGWIGAIIIGGLAGWLAEMFMKSNMGVLMNIILGIVGAAVANLVLGMFNVVLGGWVGYLIAGFIGACVLIALGRMLKRSA